MIGIREFTGSSILRKYSTNVKLEMHEVDSVVHSIFKANDIVTRIIVTLKGNHYSFKRSDIPALAKSQPWYNQPLS